MSTTLIFVELLSAGTLASVAIILMLLGFGFDVNSFEQYHDMQVIAAITGIGLAYPLGIVVDSVADWLFSRVGAKYKKQFCLKDGHTVFSLFWEKEGRKDFAEKYFEYNRIRTRMVRSFLLNSVLMLTAGLLYGANIGWEYKWLALWFFSWAIVFAVAYWSLHQLSKSWHRMLAVAWGDYSPPAEHGK